MAFMIPTSLKRLPYTTAGERLLFDLFEKRLPDSCIVRYEMLVGEREHRPDYTLIDPIRGILILEVKDWEVDRNIFRPDHEQFYIRGYRRNSVPKPQLNPDLKCQIYLREAREQLVAMSALRDSMDRLAISTSYLLAFPNIGCQEFKQKGLDKFIRIEHVLFREDLSKDGENFYRRYNQFLPELKSPLDGKQERAIIQALFTESVINPAYVRDREKVILGEEAFPIDPEQEQIAKSLGEGPRLLRGIAGTGKTLIMLYRAKLLAANNASGQLRILILCWNVSLANYMRQLYDRLQITTRNDKQVTIMHFAQFAGRFLKRQIEYEEFDDPTFAQKLGAVREFDKYDAIYIDEAQDFRREWIQFLFHCLLKGDDPKTRNLLIAADDAQKIYLRRNFSWDELDVPEDVARLYQGGDFSWSKLGISMQGRTKILKTVYRNSARVWIFAAYLLGPDASYNEDVCFSSKGGYDPELIECPSPRMQIDKAIEIIKNMLASNYAARNVLILYRHTQFGGFQWANQLQQRLTEEHIPCESITENKRYFDWQANTVKISTVHSSKGMDSPVVIVLGAETFVDRFEDQDETKLMYVALTRAREYLVVLYTGNKGLVPRLLYCHDQYSKHRPDIMEHLEKSILA